MCHVLWDTPHVTDSKCQEKLYIFDTFKNVPEQSLILLVISMAKKVNILMLK